MAAEADALTAAADAAASPPPGDGRAIDAAVDEAAAVTGFEVPQPATSLPAAEAEPALLLLELPPLPPLGPAGPALTKAIAPPGMRSAPRTWVSASTATEADEAWRDKRQWHSAHNSHNTSRALLLLLLLLGILRWQAEWSGCPVSGVRAPSWCVATKCRGGGGGRRREVAPVAVTTPPSAPLEPSLPSPPTTSAKSPQRTASFGADAEAGTVAKCMSLAAGV